MAKKKRRSSKFKDSSTVIDMDQARQERQERHEKRSREKRAREEREQKKKELRDEAQPTRTKRSVGRVTNAGPRPGASGQRLDRRKMTLRRRKRNRQLIFVGVVIALVVLVGFSLGNIIMLKHDLHVAKKEQAEYEEEKAQLEKDVEEMDDLQNLEEQARNQMRLIKPGETLYIFPENMTTTGSDQDSQTGAENQEESEE